MLSRETPNLGSSRPSDSGAGSATDTRGTSASADRVVMRENRPAKGQGPDAQGVRRLREAPLEDSPSISDGTMMKDEAGVPQNAPPESQKPLPLEADGRMSTAPTEMSEVLPAGMERSRESQEQRKDRRLHKIRQEQPKDPHEMFRTDLLHTGNGASTIGAANFAGVFQDHFKIVAEPCQTPSAERDLDMLAKKLRSGQIVRFTSSQERRAVAGKIREYNEQWHRLTDAERKRASLSQRKPYSLPGKMSAPYRGRTIDRLVRGSYDSDGVLDGTKEYRQPVLQQIAKATMLNGTYLGSDGDRLLKKVESLLPALVSQQARKRQALDGRQSSAVAGGQVGNVQRQGQQVPAQLAGGRKVSTSGRREAQRA
jgi:hypothetical protein